MTEEYELNIREQISRIDRDAAESRKLLAETSKLFAEARKFNRDPWLVLIGAIIAALTARAPEILHALGFGR